MSFKKLFKRQDKDMVRMAYNLILGREPENDKVLNVRFTDYHDLRQHFMKSPEFKQLMEERFQFNEGIGRLSDDAPVAVNVDGATATVIPAGADNYSWMLIDQNGNSVIDSGESLSNIIDFSNQKTGSYFLTVAVVRNGIAEWLKEWVEIAVNQADNQIIGIMDIAEINLSDKQFLWCINNDASDSISEHARQGIVTIETQLFSLFKTTGTFLDIGANIGAFSLPFAANGWRGYSFEASSKNAFVLRSSIVLNDFDVSVIETAIWDKTGKIYFMQNGPYGFVQNDLMTGTPYEEISCITLDDWIDSNDDIKQIDFIKIDIEGSECAALRGMKRFLDKCGYPPIFIEGNALTLCFQGETILSMLSLANDMGYKAYELREGVLHTIDKNTIPRKVLTDYLLIKNFPASFAKFDIIEEPRLSDDEIIVQIVNQLSKHASWEDHETYICYALKDYPNLYEIPEIKELLTEIAKKIDSDLFIQAAISWFVEEQNPLTGQ